jgi:Hemerythrin HHE cation binding domain
MRSLWRRSPSLLRRGGSSFFRNRQGAAAPAAVERDAEAPDAASPPIAADSDPSQQPPPPAPGLDVGKWQAAAQGGGEGSEAGFVTLGRDWALDVVGLPHNAVRRELRGLSCVVQTVESAAASVRSAAREWFWWVAQFIECVFAVEEKIIFPWLAQGGAALPGAMSTTRRAVRCGRARALCAAVDDALRRGVGVRAAADRLANVVLSHFGAVESVIPQLARAAYDPSAKERVIRAMATSLADAGPEMFVLLARGFNDDSLRARFIRVYGRRTDRAAFARRIADFEASRIDGVYDMMRAGAARPDER